MSESGGAWKFGEASAGDVVDGRFRLERIVGEGGMGVVWAARQIDDGELVAVKILQSALHGDRHSRRRVLREARAAMAVRHPNVLPVLELIQAAAPQPGDPDRTVPMIVMPLLAGETLADRLDRLGALPISDVAKLFIPVISALGTAHAHGVVHRDLKPQNLFIATNESGESPLVLDFGVAKLRASNWLASTTLTRPGVRIGTPRYMAPEQAMAGRPVDHRADVWALGTMLYECLSGVRPVEGDTAEEVLNALFDEAITPLEVVAPAVPGQVADVVDRMLSRNVAGRPGLLEVAAVFAACTDVRSPTFGMPSSEIDVADSPGSADTDEEEEAAPMARRGG